MWESGRCLLFFCFFMPALACWIQTTLCWAMLGHAGIKFGYPKFSYFLHLKMMLMNDSRIMGSSSTSSFFLDAPKSSSSSSSSSSDSARFSILYWRKVGKAQLEVCNSPFFTLFGFFSWRCPCLPFPLSPASCAPSPPPSSCASPSSSPPLPEQDISGFR